MIMVKAGKSGVKPDTPEKILFGAGTFHKNLKFTAGENGGTWNMDESIFGATNGGSKLSIVPEFVDIEIDGVYVPTKGLKEKVGETAEMEVNLIEVTEEIIKAATIGKSGVSEDALYNLIESKANVDDGDYWENVAFIGKTLKGKNIIVILENPLVTSGFESEGKSKESTTGSYTFACHADINDECASFDVLPWKIYYPKPVA